MDFKKIFFSAALIFQVFFVWSMQHIPKDRMAMYDKIWAESSKKANVTKAEFYSACLKWDRLRAKEGYKERAGYSGPCYVDNYGNFAGGMVCKSEECYITQVLCAVPNAPGAPGKGVGDGTEYKGVGKGSGVGDFGELIYELKGEFGNGLGFKGGKPIFIEGGMPFSIQDYKPQPKDLEALKNLALAKLESGFKQEILQKHKWMRGGEDFAEIEIRGHFGGKHECVCLNENREGHEGHRHYVRFCESGEIQAYTVEQFYEMYPWHKIWKENLMSHDFRIFDSKLYVDVPEFDAPFTFDLTPSILEDLEGIESYIQNDKSFKAVLGKRAIKSSDFKFIGIEKYRKRRIYRCSKVFDGKSIDLSVNLDLDTTGEINFEIDSFDALVKKQNIIMDSKYSSLYKSLEQVQSKRDKYFSDYEGIKFKNKPSDRVSTVVDHFVELSEKLKAHGSHIIAQSFANFADAFVRLDLGLLGGVMEIATIFDSIKSDLAKNWKTPDAKLSKAMQELELDAWSVYEDIGFEAYNKLSKKIKPNPKQKKLMDQVFATQISAVCKNLIGSVAGKPCEQTVINTLRVITYQGLRSIDAEAALALDHGVMLSDIYHLAQTAKSVGEIVRDEYQLVQNIVGVSDRVKRTLAPLGTFFNEAAQILDLMHGYDENYEKFIVDYVCKNCQKQIHEDGLANALTTMADGLESSLPAPGIILDPMTDPEEPLHLEVIAPEKVGIEDIKKYTGLTSRVNESLQKLAPNNKVVRVACDTNEKLNELVMQLAMDDDMEAALIMANFSREFMLGTLKRSAHIATHPVEFGLNLAGGTANLGLFLLSEYNKLQAVGDSLSSGDLGKMQGAVLAYCQDKKAQIKAFGAAINSLKEMNAEQAGELWADMLFGGLYFRALRVAIKCGNLAVAQKTEEFTTAVRFEIEAARGAGITSATEEALKTLPAMTKIAMQDGSEVAGIMSTILAEDASLLAAEKDFETVMQDVFKIEKKIDALINKGAKLRNVELLRGFEHSRTKHFFIKKGEEEFSLKLLDPNGSSSKWIPYFVDLALNGKGTTKSFPTGEFVEIFGEMPKSDGTGMLKIGVRLFKKKGADLWSLDTILTKQKTK